MHINAISSNFNYNNYSNNVSFKKDENKNKYKTMLSTYVDKFSEKNNSAKSKKLAAGLSSAVCEGLGQAVNGQWIKAGLFIGSSFIAGLIFRNSMKIALAIGLAIKALSIYDAVKTAGKE